MDNTATKIPTAAQLNDACSDAYQDALRGAQRQIRGGIFKSRGRWLRVMANGDSYVNSGEVEWRGTQKQLDVIMQVYGKMPGLEGIYIEGGINWGSNLQDYYDGDYQPWVTEWSVPILTIEE
jgi:hypothetical protein